MGKRISIKQKREQAPKWVFRWRRQGNPALAKWFAIMVAAGMFALLFAMVRIRVPTSARWAAPKASVMYLTDTAEGRALAERAREGGPFPSRFLPSEWDGAASLEAIALDATRWTPPPYVPSLRDLPEEAPAPMRLAARGEPVLPKRRVSPAAVPAPVRLALAPRIHALSGIKQEEIPGELPRIDGPIEPAVTQQAWRFLIRLDAVGQVQDCVSLAGGDDAGAAHIESWLRRVTFKTEPGKPGRWIAVEVEFTNQPAADGTDAR